MNLVKQRIAVAKACEWKPLYIGEEDPDTAIWFNFKGGRARKLLGRTITDQIRKGLPDYLNDLNAMHEAEKIVLTDKYRYDYNKWLDFVVGATPVTDSAGVGPYVYSCTKARFVTAAQRAEAFLRTLNLWEKS